jgi:hypothetical protein
MIPNEKLTAGTDLAGSVGLFLGTSVLEDAAPGRLWLAVTI